MKSRQQPILTKGISETKFLRLKEITNTEYESTRG